MAMTYATATQTARLQAVADLVENGEIELRAGATLLASWTISASLTATGNTLTISNIETNQTVNAIAAGTADNMRIQTSGAADVITGITVGVGSGEIQFDSLDVSNNQEITLASIVITHN